MSIRLKFHVITVLAFAAIGILSVIAFQTNSHVNNNVEIQNERAADLFLVGDMRYSTLIIVLTAMDCIVDKDEGKMAPERLEEIERNFAILEKSLPGLQQIAEELGQKQTPQLLKDGFAVMKQATLVDLRNAIETRGSADVFAALDDSIDGKGEEMLAILNDLRQKIHDDQHANVVRTLQVVEVATTTTVALGLVMAVTVFLSLFFISRSITIPLFGLIKVMEKMASGNIETEVRGQDRKDELGQVAKALETFRRGMQERAELQEAQRNMDKQRDQERRKTMQEMADNLENKVGAVVSVVAVAANDLKSMSDRLAQAITETSQRSNNMASSSQQTSANAQAVAAATEELSASVREIARSVGDTADAAMACTDAAKNSREDMDMLQSAIGEIDSVIQAISAVAEQTNLLALNATIEAARAGESGKGFAVVAGEVKNLANQTHKMTDEITQKMNMIKNGSNSVLRVINEIVNQIESVNGKTSTIAAAVEQQNAATDTISRNVTQAALGAQEVTENLAEVQKVANDSAIATDRMRQSSSELSREAVNLQKTVEEFLREVRTA